MSCVWEGSGQVMVIQRRTTRGHPGPVEFATRAEAEVDNPLPLETSSVSWTGFYCPATTILAGGDN